MPDTHQTSTVMTLEKAFEIADQVAPLPHLASQALRCMRAEIDRLRDDDVDDAGKTVLVGHIPTDVPDPFQASNNFTDVMGAVVAELIRSLPTPDDREIFLVGIVSASTGWCAGHCGKDRAIEILDQVKQIIRADPHGLAN